jgi:hypothetical protein
MQKQKTTPKRPRKQTAVEVPKPQEPRSVQESEASESVKSAPITRRSMWSGSISIGLINVPVKLYAMIFDRGVTFHFLHKTDNAPLKYQKICTKDGAVISWSEVAKGYEVAKAEYVVLTKPS